MGLQGDLYKPKRGFRILKRRRTLALLICGALVFAACVGGGSEGSDPEEAASSPSAEATEEPTTEPTEEPSTDPGTEVVGTPLVETDFEDGAGPWATETNEAFAIVPDSGLLSFFI